MELTLSDPESYRENFLHGGGSHWDTLATSGRHLCLWLNPPAASYLRCLDRNPRTQLRSPQSPWGLYPTDVATRGGNEVARLTAEAVRWSLAPANGSSCTIANPAGSYLWRLLDDLLSDCPCADVDLTRCMFGDLVKGPTRLRTYATGNGLDLSLVSSVCRKSGAGWACGSEAHQELGFTDAALPPLLPQRLVQKLVGIVAKWALGPTARQRLQVTDAGKVKRHADRGPTSSSRREQFELQNAASTAGARNPAGLMKDLPRTVATLGKVRLALLESMRTRASLRNGHLACGLAPARRRPREADVAEARAAVCNALGMDPSEGEAHHAASPLRYALFAALTAATEDRDTEPARWLKEGAPLGVLNPIPAGGHFPLLEGPSPKPAEILEQAPAVYKNHPSFAQSSADGSHPARDELQGLVEAGFGRLYVDRAAAEAELGGKAHPAPLGDVVKISPEGKEKHRLIQDLRRNGVNQCVHIPERQVLPRVSDHATDLAFASAAAGPGKGEQAEAFTCDYAHAFMTVPSAPEEGRFNCCTLEEPMRRARTALDNDEPLIGSFILWLVLGFGGRACPLLYARVA